jgi:hypothetical protein
MRVNGLTWGALRPQCSTCGRFTGHQAPAYDRRAGLRWCLPCALRLDDARRFGREAG